MTEGDEFSNKAEACEAADDIPVNPDTERSIGSVIARRFNRRDMLKGSLGVSAATVLFGATALSAGRAAAGGACCGAAAGGAGGAGRTGGAAWGAGAAGGGTG